VDLGSAPGLDRCRNTHAFHEHLWTFQCHTWFERNQPGLPRPHLDAHLSMYVKHTSKTKSGKRLRCVFATAAGRAPLALCI
jgi:hypothetical protein